MSKIETRIQRDQLHSALAGVLSAVERSSTLPILSNVLVRKVNGHATFTASDNVVQVTTRLDDVLADQEFSFTAQAKKFADIVSTAAGDEIKLELNEGELKLRAGRGRYTLRTLPAKDYPVMDEDAEQIGRVAVSHGHLKSALARITHAAAKSDIARSFLNAVNVSVTEGRLTLTATDGARLAQTDLPAEVGFGGDLNFLLPIKTALLLQRQLEGEVDARVEIVVCQNSVTFELGSTNIITKLQTGAFPDCKRVIPTNTDAYIVLTRDTLKAALKRICIVTDESTDHGVRLKVEGNVLLISRHSKSSQDEGHDEVDVDSNAEGFDAMFNEKFLLDMLEACQGEKINIALTSTKISTCPMLTTALGASDWLSVIMPMRA